MPRTTLLRRSLAAVAALAVLGGACSSDRPSTELTISVAASLVSSIEILANDFEASNPGVTVRINPGGSGRLATQIIEGAPADAAVLADPPAMDSLADANLLDGTPTPIATNTLTMIVAPGNPLRIDDLDDLAALPEGNRISLCALSAACGRVAELLLGDAGVVVDERRVSRGPDVTTTAAAVRRGDAAVALVFRTDARAAGDEVTEVPIVGAGSRTVEALAAALRNSPNLDLARRFVGLVASPTGQEVLTDAGFGPA